MGDEKELISLLTEGAGEYGLTLEISQVNAFLKYMDMLKDWNKKINLTAIEEDRDIIIKHFLDSVSIIPYIDNNIKNLIDIGTGAGFPGIPVKICKGEVEVTLLDSLDKRIKFLNEVINILELPGISAVHGRAEDFGRDLQYREKFDCAVARAVANLPVLLEYCLPFVKTGGLFLAMKGSNIEEVDISSKALNTLGGEIENIYTLTLPFSDIKRNIITVRKLRQTPTKYPRKAGKPLKVPLV